MNALHTRAARRCLPLLLAALVAAAGPVTSSSASTTPWVHQSPATSPPARGSAEMAFDPAIGKTVLFGGFGYQAGQALDDTWTYDGSTWTQQAPQSSPPARSGGSMAYDAAIGKIVLFGGYVYNGSTSHYFDDTWTYDGSTWTQVQTTGPPARDEASMAYDAKTGKIVLFGGSGPAAGILPPETWVFDGSSWSQQTQMASPSSRQDASMAYDAKAEEVILFGGTLAGSEPFADGEASAETWAYDGAWTLRSPAQSPPARHDASMAYSPALGEVVMFGGGSTGNTELFNDTWTFDGSSWTEQSPSASPPGQDGFNSLMADDEAGGHLVLLTNQSFGEPMAQTWTYDAAAATGTPAPGSGAPSSAPPTTPPTTASSAPVVASPRAPAQPSSTCTVPRLKGKALKAAKKRVRGADCAVGKVKKRRGASSKKGRVVGETPRPGSKVPVGTKVKITLGPPAGKK